MSAFCHCSNLRQKTREIAFLDALDLNKVILICKRGEIDLNLIFSYSILFSRLTNLCLSFKVPFNTVEWILLGTPTVQFYVSTGGNFVKNFNWIMTTVSVPTDALMISLWHPPTQSYRNILFLFLGMFWVCGGHGKGNADLLKIFRCRFSIGEGHMSVWKLL